MYHASSSPNACHSVTSDRKENITHAYVAVTGSSLADDPRSSDYVVSAIHSSYHRKNGIGLNTCRRVRSEKGTVFAPACTDRLCVLERARTS